MYLDRKAVKIARAKADLKVNDIVAYTGKSRSVITNALNGKKEIGLDTAYMISKCLNMKLDDILLKQE